VRALVVVVALLAAGCATSGLKLQAQAAHGFRTLNDEAVGLVQVACEDGSADAASDESVSADVAASNAERILSTCREIRDAQHPLAEAHGLWVMGVSEVLAETGDKSLEDLVHLGAAVIRLYHELVALARRLDIALPDLPSWLLRAVGLGEGY
jgi:hypothetical protein